MLLIGKVAEITGATRRGIRLYEELGLIPVPQRRGSYRIYSDTEVKAIALIRQAQEVGFTLAELKELVNTKMRDNRFPLEMANKLIEMKRRQLDEAMATLRKNQRRLDALQKEVSRRYGETG